MVVPIGENNNAKLFYVHGRVHHVHPYDRYIDA